MSNSPLVEHVRLSPHHSGKRTMKIDTITPHITVGQISIESLGAWFAYPEVEVSSNYGIGFDGRVGMYVPEEYRSWCTSSSANDQRAITIEIASDTTPPYRVNDVALKSLIKLCVDICKRNNIPEMRWKNDKSLFGQIDKQNVSVHRWFSSKTCPGEYIMSKLDWVVQEVNRTLKGGADIPVKKTNEEIAKEVIAGKWKNWPERKVLLEKAGYNYEVIQKIVDEMLGKNKPPSTDPLKPLNVIAREVIEGKWKNWPERKVLLEKAGYNYTKVQDEVDKILGKTKPKVDVEPYKVIVAISSLNFRRGPGTEYAILGTVRRGEVYTIVEEAYGNGANKWGRLKSGAGWIALDYVTKR